MLLHVTYDHIATKTKLLIFKAWFEDNFPDGIFVDTDDEDDGLTNGGILDAYFNRCYDEQVWLEHANTILKCFSIKPANNVDEFSRKFEKAVFRGTIPHKECTNYVGGSE